MAYHRERGGIQLHEAVGVTCKKDATTDIKAQVPSIWAKELVLDNCACVVSFAQKREKIKYHSVWLQGFSPMWLGGFRIQPTFAIASVIRGN